jgi:hypothetical protein
MSQSKVNPSALLTSVGKTVTAINVADKSQIKGTIVAAFPDNKWVLVQENYQWVCVPAQDSVTTYHNIVE